MRKVTAVLLGTMALAAATPEARAQDVLPRPFVFFVEGINPAIPRVEGPSVVADAANASNKVLAFPGGNYAWPALRWAPTTGVNVSASQAARDTMFLRIRMSPEAGTPAAHANLRLMFQDTEAANGNGMSDDDDIPFRLVWLIPDSMFDGRSYNLALPLPPLTYAELQRARNDSTVATMTTPSQPLPANRRLGPLGKRWEYQGGYNPDGFAFVSDPADGRFREFEWPKVMGFGFFWDQPNGPAGTVFVDNWYIGGSKTDLSSFQGAGAPYAGTVSATASSDSTVSIAFTRQSGAGGYRVYAVTGTGASVTDRAQAQVIGNFTADAANLTASYPAFSPHPTIPNPTFHFAVTALSAAGVENTTPTYASATVQRAKEQGFVFPLTVTEMNGLYTTFERRALSTAFVNFNKARPFRISPGHGTIETPAQVTSRADLNVVTYVGYGPSLDDPNETVMMMYSDVTDDIRVFNTDNGSGAPVSGNFFTYDELAFYLGTYRVGFPVGSTNEGNVGGQDHGVNFAILTAGTGAPSKVWPSIAQSNLFGTPLFRIKPDGTGYEILAAFLVSDLAPDAGPAVTFTRPGATEIVYHPFLIGYDEQDGAGETFNNRTGTVSTVKPGLNFSNPGWYSSPRQRQAVAFAGSSVTVANEGEEAVAKFDLGTNYPNPFGKRTTIAFSTAASGPVTLAVYDLLGRRVASLVDGVMAAGNHTASLDAAGLASGMYVYRLAAGGQVASRTMVLVK